jgi:hypothetical protein
MSSTPIPTIPSNNISIDTYCKNPQNYQKILSSTTINYYNSVCLNMNNPPDSTINKLETGAETAISAGAQGLFNVIMSMLSPQGLEGLGILFGGTQIIKIANLLSDQAIKQAIPQMVKIGELLAESTLTTVSEALIRSIGSSVIYSIVAGIKVVNLAVEAVDFVGLPLLVLSVIGAIFDAWDPCNLNTVLGRQNLIQINDDLNKVFQQKVLTNVGSFKNQQGNIEFVKNYPIEYYSDLILQNYVNDINTDYIYKIQLYQFYYLNNLVYNSRGELILNSPSNLPTLKDLDILTNNTTYFLANNNTVVQNWIGKWSPFIVAILIVIFILIFFLM